MLHVSHGPFHPSLEEALVGRIRDLKSKDPLAPVCVVAPSSRLANRVKELALRACPKGVAALQVHHLMSFAREIAPDVELIDDALLLERLVAGLIEREFPKARFLSAVAHSPRLARAILAVLLELREGAVDPEAAYTALKEGVLGDADPLKVGEILALQKAYADELERRGWSDRADLVRIAAERAPESLALGRFAEVIYYGFVELVQVQIDLLKEVVRRVPARLFYPYEKHPGYAFSDEFFAQTVLGMATSHEELKPSKLTLGLFSGGFLNARVVAASGARDEVWAAAKKILKWRDEGVAFEEIGVVARALEPYLVHVEAVFSENAIPFASNATLPAGRDPYLSAALTLLTIADEEFPRDAMISLLSSPHFRLGASGEPALWDALSRAQGIGRGADEWRRRLPPEGDYLKERGERGDERELRVPADQVARFRAAVLAVLDRARPPSNPTWASYASWASELLRDLLDPAGSEDIAGRAHETLEGLATLARVEGASEFREAALRRLSELRLPVGAPGGSGVRVLDAMAARGLPFRRLIVLGLNEKFFPRFILEEAFLRDAVRSRLHARLGSRLPLKLKGYEEERLLFTLLAASASEELVLSWQRSDEKGRVQVPSIFLREAAPRHEQVPRPPAERLAWAGDEALTRREAIVLESLRGDPARVVAAAETLGWDSNALKRGAAFLRGIDHARKPGPADGIVGRPGRGKFISPTALETFAACPFRYFAERVLRLRELDEPEREESTSALEEGLIYHGVLERFYKGLKGRMPETLEGARAAFERELAVGYGELEAQRSIRHPVLWEAERAYMRRVLEAAVTHDLAHRDGFVPMRFEWPVEGEVTAGPVKVGVRGFVDRVDLRPDGAVRVIDYKRSRSKGKYLWTVDHGVAKGRYFQPPLYLLLAEMLFAKEGIKTVREGSRSGYLFLRDLEQGDPPEMWLEGDGWDPAAGFEEGLGRAIGAIDKGEFVLRVASHCDHCDMSTVCRKQHTPTRMRAERHA